jgi:hypothetical protein
MLPRWHIFWGAIFTAVIWYFSPGIQPLYILLLFLATFLMDFDHYLNSVLKEKKISLFHAFEYHKKLGKQEIKEKKKGIKKKGDFYLFHTLEFHIFVVVLSFIWTGFLYVFIGMVFHSLLDLIDLTRKGVFYRREFFFFNWLRKQLFVLA